MTLPLAGCKAFVTGGASGIGCATARRLIADGATVVIADADARGLERVAGELGRSASGLVLDVTDWNQVVHQTREAVKRMGGLDILVTSAGVSHQDTAWDTSLEDWSGWSASTSPARFCA